MRYYLWFIVLGVFGITALHADSGRYISKKDHFSIQPPFFFNKPEIHREKNEESLLNTMIDDMGTLFRIEQAPVDISAAHIPNFVLLSGFIGPMTAAIKTAVPDAKIIDQESLVLNNDKFAQFYLFDFPKGSILAEMTTHEKFDSMRGILIFMESGKIIILSYQTDLTFTAPDAFPPNKKKSINVIAPIS